MLVEAPVKQGRRVHGEKHHGGDEQAAEPVRPELRGPAGPVSAHHRRGEREHGHDGDAARGGD